MNRKKEIIDAINAMSGKYSAYEVFSDWIRCMALSISNSLMLIHDKVWNERETAYINTMSKYSQYIGRSQLCVEIYPEIGNIYIGAYFDDETGESQELSYNIPMNFCPNCGRRLGL